MDKFNEKEIIKKIKIYKNIAFSSGGTNTSILPNGRKKVFYRFNELWGWRFYLKALRYGDFSIFALFVKNI